MKKALPVACVLAALLCCLSGCTGTSEPEDGASGGETTAYTSTEFTETPSVGWESRSSTFKSGPNGSGTTADSQSKPTAAGNTTTAGAPTGSSKQPSAEAPGGKPTSAPPMVPADPNKPTTLTWLKDQQAYASKAQGGTACPRMLTLKNGTILCAFDANDTQGGNSVIKVIQSKDGGDNWQGTNKVKKNAVMQRSDRMIYANPSMLQLSNGDVLVAYRGLSSGDGVKDSGLFVSVSHDNGIIWSAHSTVISYENNAGGVYEPCFVEIGGIPTLFYANDAVDRLDKLGTGKNPDGTHQAAVNSLSYQNIEYIQLIDGQWQNRTIACNGMNSGSRDGMPGITRLKDGRWMLAYEANNTDGEYPFILRYKISRDGLKWSTAPGGGNGLAFCIPDTEGRKTSGPALVTLPDGRVVCVFQTDQDASEPGDSRSTLRLMVSKSDDPLDGWGEWMDVFQTPDGKCSVWNGAAISGHHLFVLTSTNYPSNSIYIRRAVLG